MGRKGRDAVDRLVLDQQKTKNVVSAVGVAQQKKLKS